MRRNLHQFLLLLALLLGIGVNASAQGITTATIFGQVTDSKGNPLVAANVVAKHEPSGSLYGASTRGDGRYNLIGLRVGGPYTITVSYLGYKTRTENIISLSLGQNLNLRFTLIEDAVSLGSVDIIATQDDLLNSNRTGAATNVREDAIAALPTINRSLNDFARTTPQADIKGSSISIGGMNNRFNQIAIDGAVSNDVFGLSATGANGGGTGVNPISIDAIEELQVMVAPFDVRLGGFAGGGINAVTRSGTNKLEGSVYYFTRNQNLAGKTPGDVEDSLRTKLDNFSDYQRGFRIGGPIIKDKVFFFLNAEQTDNVTPLSFQPGSSTSNISTAEAQRVSDIARNKFGYDAGDFLDQESTNSSQKIFVRFDFNLNRNNKLIARHSYVKGEAVQLSRTPNVLTFSNGGILRKSTTNSSVIELNTVIGTKMANNLIVNYTTVREPRTAPGEPFPRVRIDLDAQRSISLGTEAFSTVNQLNQDIITITDNFTYYKNRHTITLGTHNEFYNLFNAFIGQAYGNYRFANIDSFENGGAQTFTHQYSQTEKFDEGAEFRAAQLGFYVQDEFQVNAKLRLSGGIRVDIPIYRDSPLENTALNQDSLFTTRGLANNKMPDPAFMISPRIGFNYDIKGDRTAQLRGGTGIFTSRFPFVWAGGAFTQNGVLLGRFVNNSGTQTLNPDPFGQQKQAQAGTPSGNITVLDPNFKLPQIWRTNLAFDKQLKRGYIATVEVMYSKNFNSFRFSNLNLKEPTQTLVDGRVLHPAALNDKRFRNNYTEIVLIDNVNEGSAYTFTAQLQKQMTKGFMGSVAYTFTGSKDLFPGTSSQNQSNYYRVANVNGANNAEVGFSPFNVGSRIVAFASKRFEYAKYFATTLSLFYTGQSGTPFSYTYQGNLNRSAFGNEFFDLMYVPTQADFDNGSFQLVNLVSGGDTISPAQQWANLNEFIDANPYLADKRGEFTERNGDRTPFTHRFDLKIAQDIYTKGRNKNTLQLTLDIFNVGNLLNKKWGTQYAYGTSYFDNTFRVLTVRSYSAPDANGVVTPRYTFNKVPNNEPFTISDNPLFGSRWVGQIGIRYIFN